MRPILLSLFLLLLAASCSGASAPRAWEVNDLRFLDPADSLPPSSDLLAGYIRFNSWTIEIRLDFLDLSENEPLSLQVALQDEGRFADQPLVVEIFSAGTVRASQGTRRLSIRPRVALDDALDTLTLRLNRLSVRGRFCLDLSTGPDEVNGICSDDPPPGQQAPALIAFWETFPAVTPAQALRYWDGAHTGPHGVRHGLRHVLNGVEKYQIPVVLLDLKTPSSLAVLSSMGVLPQVQSLEEMGLLTLPLAAYAEPAAVSLDFSRRAAIGFGLADSSFLYRSSPVLFPNASLQFFPLEEPSHLALSGNTRLVPLPAGDGEEATAEGLSLEARRELIAVALSADPADLVVLGGDLLRSAWGDMDKAGPTFAWLAAHPWIRPLAGEALLALPAEVSLEAVRAGDGEAPFSFPLPDGENCFTTLAWLTYLMLHSPTEEGALSSLRAQYGGQVNWLLEAAKWAAAPLVYLQGGDEGGRHVLSNSSFFAVIDNTVGKAVLTHLFALDSAGLHQIVAPSSQFALGLSDPSEWRLELGEAADPSVIPGAFEEEWDTWAAQPPIAADRIVFTSPDGRRFKTYQLSADGLRLFYQGTGAVHTRLPLALDPQAFYFRPTQYQERAQTPWTWGLLDGVQVTLDTTAILHADAFTATLPLLSQPENPDQNFPAGHYLPFPLAVVTLQSEGDFDVGISVRPSP